MDKIDFLPNSNCCTPSKKMVEGCSNGTSFLITICEPTDCGGTPTLSYLNMSTGVAQTTPPDDFVLGNCMDKTFKVGCLPFLETQSFTAVAGQTLFTIANEASGDVRVSINGDTVSDNASLVSGSAVTYVPAENANKVLVAGDRVDITYVYAICDIAVEPFVDCAGNEILNGTGLLTCDSLGPDFAIDPTTGEISLAGFQAPDFKPNPIGTTPTPSGNVDNRNSFVIDPNGDIYFIDKDGEAFKVNTTQTVTTLTNTVDGHRIGTYNNEAGVAVDIEETITSIGTMTFDPATGVLSIPYIDEAGVTNIKTVTLTPELEDARVCYSVTETIAGTPQSPANGTALVPNGNSVEGVWVVNGTASTTGTPTGTGTFNLPWYVSSGTPMVITDDNGTGAKNVRLDQGDSVSSDFSGYAGVVYEAGLGFRKITGDGLGAAGIKMEIRKPDGTIVLIDSGTSTRQGGAGGWDRIGEYEGAGLGTFTANQSGIYTFIVTGTSTAPTRFGFGDVKVKNASGEVVEDVTTVSNYVKVTSNNVTKYYDEDGVEVTGAALTALLATIAAGDAEVIECASCGCLPEDFISTDADNDLVLGTDGKLYVPAAEPETVTTMTDVKATGDLIGTYTNEEGDEVEIRQSITSIGTITYDSTNGLLTIPHTDETGTVNNKTVTLPRPLNVLTTTQATPTPTGNTQNLNSTFKDAQGNTWIVDHEGHAILAGSAPFKELNQFHVCKAGNNTTGTGADENPFLTVQKGIDTAGQADAVIVNEGTYAEAITIATQNLTVRGEGQEYGGLTEVNSIAVTANGTSVRVSALTSTGAITHSGTSPLYLSEMTVVGNFTSSTTAYTEIKDSRLQDGTISKTAAGILFIQDSLIGNATFSTANSVISLRNVTIDAGKKVTIGAGVIYNMQDVVGEVEINAAAIPLEAAILAQGGTAEQAKAAQTSSFNMLRMLDPDTEASPTKIVTWDEVTGRLEVSNLSAIASAPSVTFGTATPPTGGTPKEGDVYFVTSTGTSTGDVTEQWIYDATSSTWVKAPSGSTAPTSTPLHQFEEANATSGQTAYTLQKTPILGSTGKVRVSRNGIDITRAWTWSGNIGTYDPAKNYNCVLDVNDNLQFEYEASEIISLDKIADGLTTSLTAYNAAEDGTWVEITEAEYAAIQTSVSGVTKAGQLDNPALYTATYEFGDMGFGNTATTTPAAEAAGVTGAVPANSWIYAYQYKTGGPASNRTYYLQLGTKGSNSGFASVMPAISNTTNAGGQLKSYIYKGGVFVPTTKDIASIGGTISYAGIPNHTSWWAGGTANSVPASISTYGNVWDGGSGGPIQQAQFQQVLTTPTKQW